MKNLAIDVAAQVTTPILIGLFIGHHIATASLIDALQEGGGVSNAQKNLAENIRDIDTLINMYRNEGPDLEEFFNHNPHQVREACLSMLTDLQSELGEV
ncbi:MAG: hypothetical protein OXK78_07855 [Caldilineaceae bacterium]|nr:hypothetical protein [Caldilineaceae bacterium]